MMNKLHEYQMDINNRVKFETGSNPGIIVFKCCLLKFKVIKRKKTISEKTAYVMYLLFIDSFLYF